MSLQTKTPDTIGLCSMIRDDEDEFRWEEFYSKDEGEKWEEEYGREMEEECYDQAWGLEDSQDWGEEMKSGFRELNEIRRGEENGIRLRESMDYLEGGYD